MMFAGRCGMNIMLDDLCRGTQTSAIVETLFNEELGAVRLLRENHPIM
jgi:phosphoribosylformylglycinamidine synthase